MKQMVMLEKPFSLASLSRWRADSFRVEEASWNELMSTGLERDGGGVGSARRSEFEFRALSVFLTFLEFFRNG